MLMIKEINK